MMKKLGEPQSLRRPRVVDLTALIQDLLESSVFICTSKSVFRSLHSFL